MRYATGVILKASKAQKKKKVKEETQHRNPKAPLRLAV